LAHAVGSLCLFTVIRYSFSRNPDSFPPPSSKKKKRERIGETRVLFRV
jgi:hypothetical protein